MIMVDRPILIGERQLLRDDRSVAAARGCSGDVRRAGELHLAAPVGRG
jgi:hypothetical protein